jgi:hypothetical protein
MDTIAYLVGGLLLYGTIGLALYWIIRLGVRHGMRDNDEYRDRDHR